jgi:hypothetical protein
VGQKPKKKLPVGRAIVSARIGSPLLCRRFNDYSTSAWNLAIILYVIGICTHHPHAQLDSETKLANVEKGISSSLFAINGIGG